MTDFGKHFLNTDINKVVYISEEIVHLFTDINEVNTKIIPYKKEDMYFYEYKDSLTRFNLASDNNSKDTIEYMFLMCHKTEFIRNAISLNLYDSDNYVWVDFGIKHIFKNDEISFADACNGLKNKSYDKVRIGSIWDVNIFYHGEVHSHLKWYFAGGVFGGNREALLKFADLTKDKCINTMVNAKTLMWEVNIWYLIYLDNRWLFDLYKCDHDPSLILNY